MATISKKALNEQLMNNPTYKALVLQAEKEVMEQKQASAAKFLGSTFTIATLGGLVITGKEVVRFYQSFKSVPKAMFATETDRVESLEFAISRECYDLIKANGLSLDWDSLLAYTLA